MPTAHPGLRPQAGAAQLALFDIRSALHLTSAHLKALIRLDQLGVEAAVVGPGSAT